MYSTPVHNLFIACKYEMSCPLSIYIVLLMYTQILIEIRRHTQNIVAHIVEYVYIEYLNQILDVL